MRGYQKLDEQRRKNDVNTLRNLFYYFILPILAMIAITGFVLAILAYINSLKKFSAVTDFDVAPDSMSIIDDNGNDVYVVPCTNLSIGDDHKEFTRDTYFGVPCSETGDICSINFCKTDGLCERQLLGNSTCYQDSQCSTGGLNKCDMTTCQCVQEDDICLSDSDCPIVSNNLCENYTCISGTCTLDTIAGMECSTNQECAENEICGPSCTCVSTNLCLVNSDCPLVNNNSCENYTCVSGVCTLGTIPGMGCSTNQECAENEYCGDGCQCVQNNFCLLNSDCPLVDNNSCENYTCVSNVCTLGTIAGMGCATNQDCGVNEYCGLGCTCVSTNATVDPGWVFYSGGYTSTATVTSGTTITLAITTTQTSGAIFSSLASNEVTFTEAGDYIIDYSIICGAVPGATITEILGTVEVDTGSGFATLSYPGFIFPGAAAAGEINTFAREFAYTASLGDILRFRFDVNNDNAQIFAQSGREGFFFTIKRFT